MPKPDLTIRERKLVKGVAKGLPKYKAAQEAGYSPNNPNAAGATASEVLRKPKVQAALLVALEKAGITDDKLAEVIKQGMAAKKVVAHVVAKNGAPTLIERPDHAVRHKFAETVIDVMGAKAAKQVQVSGFDDLLNELDDDTDGAAEDESPED